MASGRKLRNSPLMRNIHTLPRAVLPALAVCDLEAIAGQGKHRKLQSCATQWTKWTE